MKTERQPAFHTRRDAWVEVNLTRFEQNVTKLLAALPKSLKMMAVIKADAYGHGAPMMVPILESLGVAMLGVASVDEALQLKATKTQLPILILGPSPDWALSLASQNGYQATIFSPEHVAILKQHFEQTGQTTQVQIKVDTGMHRIGIQAQKAAEFVAFCQAQPFLDVQGVFTHLADAVNTERRTAQYQLWQTVLKGIKEKPQWIHATSSEAILDPDALEQGNLVRVGLSLFGYGNTAKALGLKPLMQLKARISHIHELPSKEGVSYGFSYINKTSQPQKIASLPIGYADGLPRGLSNQIQFAYQGKACAQLGAICMDQCLFDVTAVPEAKVGDVVTLMGDVQSLSYWAKVLHTIEYELMCGLRVRLPRTFVR